jgi:hypothetical protein
MSLRWVQALLFASWCALPWLASRFALSQKASWRRRRNRVRLIWAVWLTSTLFGALRFWRGFGWLARAFDWLLQPSRPRDYSDVLALAAYVFAGFVLLLGWQAYRIVRVCEGCMSINIGMFGPPRACRSCERLFDESTDQTDVELVRSAVTNLRLQHERTPDREEVLAYLNDRGEHFSRRRMKRLLFAIKHSYRLKNDKAAFEVLG